MKEDLEEKKSQKTKNVDKGLNKPIVNREKKSKPTATALDENDGHIVTISEQLSFLEDAKIVEAEKIEVDAATNWNESAVAEHIEFDKPIDSDKITPIKVRRLQEPKAKSNINKFDLIFIKIWTVIVALVGKIANGLNYLVKLIVKKRIPDKYMKAFVSCILVVCTILLCALPFSIQVQPDKSLSVFNNGLAPVKQYVGVDTEGYPIFKWGYVNNKNEVKIEAQFEEASEFAYGVAWVRIEKKDPDTQILENYWQLIDTKGRPKGKDGLKFYANTSTQGARPVGEFGKETKLAWVNVSGMYGYINTNGVIAIESKYSYAESFKQTRARVRMGHTEFYINEKGKQISDSYQEVRSFSEGLGAVCRNQLWGFVDLKGKVVVDPSFDDVSEFYGGYAIVRRVNNYGIIDKKGKYVVWPNMFADFITNNPEFNDMLNQMQDRV